MPPKKKSDKNSTSKEYVGPVEPTELEIQLQQELEELQKKLGGLKEEVETLRKESDFLQREAAQTRTESHEYLAFMSKKTNLRKNTIISLSDQNEAELRKISKEKDQVLSTFEQRKEELKDQLMEKESVLAKINQEYKELEDYQALREEQLETIKDLEKEVVEKRNEYSESIQNIKTEFLTKRANYAKESDEKIKRLAKEANKKAVLCLEEHAKLMKTENKNLRTELMELLKRSSMLNEHKQQLEKQNADLVREQQYSNDILRLRGEKHRNTETKH